MRKRLHLDYVADALRTCIVCRGAIATAVFTAELLFDVVGKARKREEPLGQHLGRNPIERNVLRKKERIAEKPKVARCRSFRPADFRMGY